MRKRLAQNRKNKKKINLYANGIPSLRFPRNANPCQPVYPFMKSIASQLMHIVFFLHSLSLLYSPHLRTAQDSQPQNPLFLSFLPILSSPNPLISILFTNPALAVGPTTPVPVPTIPVLPPLAGTVTVTVTCVVVVTVVGSGHVVADSLGPPPVGKGRWPVPVPVPMG